MSTCVCCGVPVPEGRQVCPNCETWSPGPDGFLPDGTPLYLKTKLNLDDLPLQLQLYQQLLDYKHAMQKEK